MNEKVASSSPFCSGNRPTGGGRVDERTAKSFSMSQPDTKQIAVNHMGGEGMEARTTPELDADLSDSLRAGATLPAPWYTTESIFRQETRAIFSRYWQYVCHLDEL